MQPLHKIYGLITYLTFTIYSYNKIKFPWILQLISIFVQKLLQRKLQILNFTIYYISIPMMIQNHVKSNNYSIYMNMKIFQTTLD
jgi:hypothetical protein